MKKSYSGPLAFGLIILFSLALLIGAAACASSPTPTSSPSPAPSASASPTPTATAAVSPVPSASPSPTPSVTAAPPSISTSSLPDGVTGTAYSQNLQAAGGTGNRVWLVTSGILPAGLTLDAKSGTISGTPKAAALYFFTVSAVDSAGPGSSKALSVNVALAPAQASAVFITTNSLPSGLVANSYSQTLQATGGSGVY
jgi:large repetitive protein